MTVFDTFPVTEPCSQWLHTINSNDSRKGNGDKEFFS